MDQPIRETLLRRSDVEARTGLARSTLYDLITRGEFPKSIPLVGRTVAWTESSVSQWISDRISAAQSDAAQ